MREWLTNAVERVHEASRGVNKARLVYLEKQLEEQRARGCVEGYLTALVEEGVLAADELSALEDSLYI